MGRWGHIGSDQFLNLINKQHKKKGLDFVVFCGWNSFSLEDGASASAGSLIWRIKFLNDIKSITGRVLSPRLRCGCRLLRFNYTEGGGQLAQQSTGSENGEQQGTRLWNVGHLMWGDAALCWLDHQVWLRGAAGSQSDMKVFMVPDAALFRVMFYLKEQ